MITNLAKITTLLENLKENNILLYAIIFDDKWGEDWAENLENIIMEISGAISVVAEKILEEDESLKEKGYNNFISAEERDAMHTINDDDADIPNFDEFQNICDTLIKLNNDLDTRREKADTSLQKKDEEERLRKEEKERKEKERIEQERNRREEESRKQKEAEGKAKKDKEEKERKQREEEERIAAEKAAEEERLRKEEAQRIAAEKAAEKEREQKETITQNLNKIYDLLDELEEASGLETLNRKYDALTLQSASTPDKLKQKENDTKNLLKLVEAKKDLLEINNEIKRLKQNGNDTLALERKYDKVSDMLNKDDANAEKVEESVSALKASLSNVDNLTKVKFAGNGWLHDGTVENVYNCLKDADFDIDRIENLKDWKTSYQNVLGTMRISTDGQTLEAKAKASSCGTGAGDYRHKAMLKTLATFAMEGYKQDGTAKTVADPSKATADDVKIDGIAGLKEFVESKK